jgi:Na+/melibiose symporter-like transporter
LASLPWFPLIAAASVKGMEARQRAKTSYLKAFPLSEPAQRKKPALLLSLKFYGAIATGCLTASFPYFAAHVLGDKGLSTMGIAAYTVCAAISIPFWNRLTRKHDKRNLLLIANTLVALLLFWLGIGAQNVTRELFLAGCGLMGSVFAAYLFIPYSFVPDLVEFYEYTNGGAA